MNIDIQELVAQHGVENVQFTIPMRVIHATPFRGLGFTCSNDPETQVRCKIDETSARPRPYVVSEGYKILLVPMDETIPAYETFYQSDLESLIRRNPDRFQVHVMADA